MGAPETIENALTEDISAGEKCIVCQKSGRLWRCKDCKTGKYCSKKCHKIHFPHHSKYCSYISQLENIQLNKIHQNFPVREEQVDATIRLKIVKLIGEKPLLKCKLDGLDFEVLWDTGSMISLIDLEWAKSNFPDKNIIPIEEFLGEEKLEIRAANATKIDFEGVMLLDFSTEMDANVLTIPFLVSSGKVNEPILGYNVIEDLITNKAKKIEGLKSCFSCGPEIFERVVSVIQERAHNSDFICPVKSPDNVKLVAQTSSVIKCKVKVPVTEVEKSVLFSPEIAINDNDLYYFENLSSVKRGRNQHVYVNVINPTKEDIHLRKGALIGTLFSVSAVLPIDFNEILPKKMGVCSTAINAENQESPKVGVYSDESWMSKVDLSHLNNEQRSQVEKLLRDERDVFTKSESDIGDIPEFQMKINLTDEVPVKEAYRQLPRSLYGEVRNYVNDLLLNGWIRESISSYGSPVVCVRKKDNTLRMCIDYRKLNKKTIPDAQPIPRTQDILNNLHGQKINV